MERPEERRALIASLVFHGLIAAICIIGLPHLKPPPLEIMQPIPIDIMELGPVTTTSKIADSNIAKPPEPAPQQKEMPPQPATPPQQKQEPAPTPPAPKPVPKAEPKPEPAPAEDKNADIPKPPPKKTPPKKEPKPVDDSQQVAALLKNLAQDKPVPSPVPAPAKTLPKPATSAAGSPGIQSDHLTISQEDALRRQIEQCWSVSAGGKGVSDMIVELHVEMNPDRTVKTAKIVSVSVDDAYGRAIADSALRAVLNPKCSPYNLPEDRFEMWREINMRFNPKDLL